MEIITSRKNDKVTRLKKLGADRKYRRETGLFLGDGKKLLEEAVKRGLRVECVLYSGDEEPLAPGAELYKVSRDIIDSVSPLRSPQDVLFSCRIPECKKEPASGSVILENIQDPGNLGSIIRSANAFGVKAVMLLGSCADLYNPKTLRGGMGAVFREKVFKIEYEDVATMKKQGIRVYGAALHENSVPINKADFKNSVVVIGNEGSGITPRLLEMCSEKIIIPMEPECESLNAASAASVIMWEMGKSLRG